MATRSASRKSLNDLSTTQGKVALGAITLVLVMSFLCIFRLNPLNVDESGVVYAASSHHYVDMNQYARVADALLHGRLSLDLPVPQELLNLESPYVTSDRIEIGSEDVPIFWDCAFYDGNYYS